MAITSANVWYNILHTYLDYNIYQGKSNIKWHNICQNKHNHINIPNNIIGYTFTDTPNQLYWLEQHFPQTWRSHDRIWQKLV